MQIPLNGVEDAHDEEKEVTILVTGYGVSFLFIKLCHFSLQLLLVSSKPHPSDPNHERPMGKFLYVIKQQ